MRPTRHEAVVEWFKPFRDGLGAPAIVTCRGFTWAFDFLGEVRRARLDESVAPTREVHEALQDAAAAYLRCVANLGAEWRERNAAEFGAAVAAPPQISPSDPYGRNRR